MAALDEPVSLNLVRRVGQRDQKDGPEAARWAFYLMVPASNIDIPVNDLAWEMFFMSCAIILLAVTAGMLFAAHVIRPIRTLAKSMKALGVGDLRARVPVAGTDEFGRLGEGFNAMADQLKCTVEDLNATLAAQALSEARTRAIMDTAADVIVTVSDAGLIESINPAVQQVFGYEPAEVIGRKFYTLLSLRDTPDNASRQSGLGRTDSHGICKEIQGRRKDGSIVHLELTIGEARVGDTRLLTATFHDLTLRKQIEMELRQARDAAEAAKLAMSRFLAATSHELRTPLASVIGYSELLQEIAQDEGQSRLLPDLEKIRNAGKHLLTIINDILDLAKIEDGRRVELSPETFDLPAMIRDSAVTIRPVVEKNGNAFHVECDESLGTIRTDVTRLRQCIFNLLSNAGKFTEHGSVRLHVTRARRGSRLDLFPGGRHRHRPDAGAVRPALQAIHSAWAHGDAPVRRHRSWPVDQPQT